jgi:hypothetical protein
MPSRKVKFHGNEDTIVAQVSSRYTSRGLVQKWTYEQPPSSSPVKSSPEKSPKKKRKLDYHWDLDIPIDPLTLDPLEMPQSKVCQDIVSADR